jgi:hypothetical protein
MVAAALQEKQDDNHLRWENEKKCGRGFSGALRSEERELCSPSFPPARLESLSIGMADYACSLTVRSDRIWATDERLHD